MRNLIILLTLLFSTHVFAITDVDRAEFKNQNALAKMNPGFESGKALWTCSPAITIDTGTQIASNSKSFAKWDSTSAGQTCYSQSVTVPTVGNCEANLLTKNASGGTHLFVAHNGTSEILSKAIDSQDGALVQRLIFPCPSSGTVKIGLKSVAANEPSVSFDNAWVGIATGVGSGMVATPTTVFTPTGSWTTNSTYSGVWWRVGDRYHFRVRVGLSGAPNATLLTINYLPSGLGFSVDTAKMLSTATNASVPFAKCNIRVSPGHYESEAYYNANNLAVFAINSASTYAAGSNVTQTIPVTFANGDSVECASIDGVPIVGWTASDVVSADQQRAPKVTHYLSGSGTHTWSNGVTHATIEIIGGGGGGGGAGTSSTAGGAGGQSSFDGVNAPGGTGGGNGSGGSSGGPGAVTAVPCTTNETYMCRGGARGAAGSVADGGAGALHSPGGHGGQSRYGGAGLGLYESTGASAQANTGSGGAGGAGDAGTYYAGAGGTAGADITWHRVAPSGSASYSVGAAGAAGTGTRNGGVGGSGYIKVTEYFGATTALLANSVSTGTANGEVIHRAQVDTSGASTCTVQNQSTGFVASASASSTVCTLTLNPVFSADPTCTVSRNTTGAAIIGTVAVNSSTSVAVALWDTSGAIQTGSFNLMCMGPR